MNKRWKIPNSINKSQIVVFGVVAIILMFWIIYPSKEQNMLEKIVSVITDSTVRTNAYYYTTIQDKKIVPISNASGKIISDFLYRSDINVHLVVNATYGVDLGLGKK